MVDLGWVKGWLVSNTNHYRGPNDNTGYTASGAVILGKFTSRESPSQSLFKWIVGEKRNPTSRELLDHAIRRITGFVSHLQGIRSASESGVYRSTFYDGVQCGRWASILQVKFKMNVGSVDGEVERPSNSNSCANPGPLSQFKLTCSRIGGFLSRFSRSMQFRELIVDRLQLLARIVRIQSGSYGHNNSSRESPKSTVPQRIMPDVYKCRPDPLKGYMYITLGAIVFVMGVCRTKASGNFMENNWHLGVAGIVFGLLIVLYRLVIHRASLIDPM